MAGPRKRKIQVVGRSVKRMKLFPNDKKRKKRLMPSLFADSAKLLGVVKILRAPILKHPSF